MTELDRPRLCKQYKKAYGEEIFSFSKSGAALAAPLLFSVGYALRCKSEWRRSIIWLVSEKVEGAMPF